MMGGTYSKLGLTRGGIERSMVLPRVAYFSLLFFARLTVVVVDFLPPVGKKVGLVGTVG